MRRKDTIPADREGRVALALLTPSAGVAEDSWVAEVSRVALPAPPAGVAGGTPAGDLPVHVQVAVPGELVAGGGERAGTDLALQPSAGVSVVARRTGGLHLTAD